MIDIEDEVFTRVQTAVIAEYPNALIVGKETRAPSKFPCVSIMEMDNAVLERTQDSDSQENHAVLMYEVNVYSNKSKGSKAECKAIFAIVDSALSIMGFSRIMKNPVSLDDATKYRIVGRYSGVAGTDNHIYRR